MLLVISRDGDCGHQGSMKCERCFPKIAAGEKEGPCIIQQVDDGSNFLTLVVCQEGRRDTFVLTLQQMAAFMGEDWSTIMNGIEEFKVNS